MSRKFLVPLLAAAFLAAPAFAPVGLSASALAEKATTPTTNAKNLNSSRSNIWKASRTTTVKSSKSNTSDRMGPGGHGSSARTTTVKSSKSNTSDRLGGGGMGSGGFRFGR